ncbi:MAG: aminotransferase class V-fold PLP-dependent enzyme, partial [Oscillospiraceae bacterium]|nr:aminotransferase class V-fold PLP-dependent enzyme [Oscillospiraceae bacterium]
MIYFDNAATTKPAKSVAETIYKCLEDNFGNPSSLHALGLKAEQTMSAARKTIADALGVPAETVYFTSGATE